MMAEMSTALIESRHHFSPSLFSSNLYFLIFFLFFFEEEGETRDATLSTGRSGFFLSRIRLSVELGGGL